MLHLDILGYVDGGKARELEEKGEDGWGLEREGKDEE